VAITEVRIEQRPGPVYTAAQKFRWLKTTPEDAGFNAEALENVAQLAALDTQRTSVSSLLLSRL